MRLVATKKITDGERQLTCEHYHSDSMSLTMPRAAKLRRKEGYWFTQAGGQGGAYFGRIDEVPYAEARKKFGAYLASCKYEQQQARLPVLSVAEICDRHLGFVKNERSDALYKQRKCLLNGLCNHVVDLYRDRQLAGHGQKLGMLRSERLSRSHVEQYLQTRRETPSKKTGKPVGDKMLRGIVVSVKACWNWAADEAEDGGGGLLVPGHRPLRKLPRGFVAPKDLSEIDLPTDEEIEILHRWAAVDLSKERGSNGKFCCPNPSFETTCPDGKQFAEILRLYDATGARTSELCNVVVGDFMPRTRQLSLGKHKRTHTQATPTVRNIQLDNEAFKIVARNARGKQPEEPLFSHQDGRAWTQNQVNKRLRAVKAAAAQQGEVVRNHITPYSFRDLYISELLMINIEPFKVAKMAGTSLRELERTYGHFFTHDLAEAQARLAEAQQARRGSTARTTA